MSFNTVVYPIDFPAYITATAFLLASTVAWVIYARVYHPLAKVPGPLLASITRLWLVYDVATGAAEKTQARLHKRYGPIVRIAPNEVAIANPEAINNIYSAHSGFTKTDFYLPFRATWARYPDAFTNLNERQHAERRRIVNRLYSLSSVLQSEERIETCVTMLMEQLCKRAMVGEVVDLAEWVQWYTFDVIGELFFSRKFGFMEKAIDHEGYIDSLNCLIPFIAVACTMPAFMRPLFFISGVMIPRVSRALKALRHIEMASDACIAQRLHETARDQTSKKGQDDMLDGCLAIWRAKGEEKDFTLTEVKMEVYGAFIAGSDTTAAAITSILYHLLRTPHAYKRLTAEIDEATLSGMLHASEVQYHEAVGLPYLVACCKEGMRLHPSVGLTLPRHVPTGGRAISGHWFAAGTRVGINAAVVHRNKDIFGDDADAFVPERWFRKGAAKMDRMMFQFGSGSRICIGKNISMCEIYKLVPQLLRSFEVRLVDPSKDWSTRNYWFNKPANVQVYLKARNTA